MKNLKVLLIVLGVGAFFAFNSPDSIIGKTVKGDGEMISKEIKLDPFDAIGLAIPADVILKQGSPQRVEIDAEQNIINNIKTKVRDGSWNIAFKEKVRKHEKITIYITIPDLTAVSVAGSGDVMSKGAFKNMGNLDVSIAGSGDVKLKGDSKKLNISVAGSGDVEMQGSATSVDISIAGSGDVNLEDLSAGNCDISIAGSGNCKVNSEGSLDVSIVGSGDVYYTGGAKVNSSVMGSGKVHKM